jgi:hypothetical protein
VKHVALLALGILVAGAVQAEPEFHDLTCHLHYAEDRVASPQEVGDVDLRIHVVVDRASPHESSDGLKIESSHNPQFKFSINKPRGNLFYTDRSTDTLWWLEDRTMDAGATTSHEVRIDRVTGELRPHARLRGSPQALTTRSISTQAPSGSAATVIVVRAGKG